MLGSRVTTGIAVGNRLIAMLQIVVVALIKLLMSGEAGFRMFAQQFRHWPKFPIASLKLGFLQNARQTVMG